MGPIRFSWATIFKVGSGIDMLSGFVFVLGLVLGIFLGKKHSAKIAQAECDLKNKFEDWGVPKS